MEGDEEGVMRKKEEGVAIGRGESEEERVVRGRE